MLTTESSIHILRVLKIKILGRVIYVEISKNENTWYRVLTHYDAKYNSILSLSKRNSKGGDVTEGILYVRSGR